MGETGHGRQYSHTETTGRYTQRLGRLPQTLPGSGFRRPEIFPFFSSSPFVILCSYNNEILC